ncbi:gtpase activating rab protein, partial [Moniliophthora roreri]
QLFFSSPPPLKSFSLAPILSSCACSYSPPKTGSAERRDIADQNPLLKLKLVR